ncbi:YbaB/EbfC family nucleoid-associated protein [Nonomuraea sp. NPDC047897]|uniref:YbaB/EbfC family nucleoid-associated protein n=1 Tax=Nonomuraea sp. NPDC047897 TaxID=3364346 RepID=UPI0037166E35
MPLIDASGSGEGEEGFAPLFREIGCLTDAFADELREAEGRRVTGADGAGRVVATVSGSARLLHLRIDPRAMRDLDHTELSQAVLDAVRAAREAAAEGVADSLGRLNAGRPQPGPDDNPLGRYLDAMLREADRG